MPVRLRRAFSIHPIFKIVLQPDPMAARAGVVRIAS